MMVINVELLSRLVCQLTISFHTILGITLHYRRTTKKYEDFPNKVIFQFLPRKFVIQTWFCNCLQYLCLLFHILVEYNPNKHDHRMMLVGSSKSTSFMRILHIGSMFCFFPASFKSSTYTHKNNLFSRSTNKHSQF